jgi:fibronectin type 3 domain-containing protein
VAFATSYNIYQSEASGTGTKGTPLSSTASPYVIHGLTNDVTYYFVVTAVTPTAESTPSSEVSATPPGLALAPPANVTATDGAASATVSWHPVKGATSYNVYYSTASGTGMGGTKVHSATSPLEITGLDTGVTYYFVVTAVNSDGESAASSEVSATPT